MTKIIQGEVVKKKDAKPKKQVHYETWYWTNGEWNIDDDYTNLADAREGLKSWNVPARLVKFTLE